MYYFNFHWPSEKWKQIQLKMRSKTVLSSFVEHRKSSISFRQYLLPKNEEQTNSNDQHIRYHYLTDQLLTAIGDVSVIRTQKSIRDRLITFYKGLGIILRPDNWYLLGWELLIMLIIIYYNVTIGLMIGFGQAFWQDEYSTLFGLQIFFTIVLVCDIIISPLKAYYSQGLLIKEVPQIFKKYIKLEFYLDILGLITVIIPLVVGTVDSNWIKVLWILKLYTVDRVNEYFQRMTQLYIIYNTIYLVIKLVIISLYYAHFMGIFFYLVSLHIYNTNYYGPNTPNIVWVYNSWAFYQMAFLPWYQMYAYIMYYSIAVVTTIAYGDITPKNPIECIYTIFALIFQAILWGYILSEILRLLVNVYTYNFERRFHHYALNFKLKESLVSESTFKRVQKHTEEIDRDQQYRNRAVQENVLRFLPPDPLYGLLLVIYKEYLKKIGLKFAENLSYKSIGPAEYKSIFLERFMPDIKEQRYFAGDVLYEEGEVQNSKPTNHRAYFFTSDTYKTSVVLGIGKHIKLALDASQSKYVVIEEKGSFELYRPETVFGTMEFLTGRERSHWAICLQNCLVFSVSRSSILNNYNLLTLQERQSIALSVQNAQERKCLICKQEHFFLRCPYSFATSKIVSEPSQNVKRMELLGTHNRTRLKSMSAWRLYPTIAGIKMQITNQYKHLLYMSTMNHNLFVELQLDEDLEQQEEDLQHQIHQTEVILESLYRQELDEHGLNEEFKSYDQVHNFTLYRPQENIKSISNKLTKLKNVRPRRNQIV